MKTLILIPGFANPASVWKHQVDNLSSGFHIQVPVMDKEKSRDQMVRSVLETAPDRFCLAGHSMGGWVAQAVAAAAPDRVDRLVLLNTWATPEPARLQFQRQVAEELKAGRLKEVMERHLSLIVHPSKLQDAGLIQALVQMVSGFTLEALLRQLEAMLADYSSLHLLPSIVAPTLVVHSREDALFPITEQEVLISGIPDAKFAIIEHCGHASIVERPEIVNGLMRQFFTFS